MDPAAAVAPPPAAPGAAYGMPVPVPPEYAYYDPQQQQQMAAAAAYNMQALYAAPPPPTEAPAPPAGPRRGNHHKKKSAKHGKQKTCEHDSQQQQRHQHQQKAVPPAQEATVLANFIRVVNQFLTSLRNTFDDCPVMQDKWAEFQAVVIPNKAAQELFIERYHRAMEPWYDACTSHNPEPFLSGKVEIGLLKEIDFANKYAEIEADDADGESRKCLWEYVNEMNKYARIYATLPKRIMGKIEGIATKLAKNIQRGKLSLADLNVLEIGKSVLEDATAAEINDMMGSMGTLCKAVGGVEGLAQATQGAVQVPPALGKHLDTLVETAQRQHALATSAAAAAPAGSSTPTPTAAAAAATAAAAPAPPPPTAARGWKPK